MKKQAGFTLIELVIVIIILGILAVTAAPKFLNLQDDARYSAAQGVQAALQSSSQMIYSKAAIAGLENTASGATVSVAISTTDTGKTNYGYPVTDEVAKTVTLDGWKVSGASATSSDFYPDNTKGNECYVTYTAATSETVPFKVELKNCK